MIKVILADDQNIVRSGIRNVLEKDGKFEVIGEASNADELFEILKKGVIPDIILSDTILPEWTGTILATKSASKKSETKLVVLTSVDSDNYLLQAFRSGAMGYLLKSISSAELLFALSFIHHHNQKYISSEIALRQLDRISHLPQLDGLNGHNGHDGLPFSKRETEVLGLISQGYTNQQIADKLFTSRRTVEGHRQSLMDKANVRNSAALVRFAFRNNLLQ